MKRLTTIQYAWDEDTGQVWSRVDDKVAVPVLDFEGMTPENGWDMKWPLQKMSIFDTIGSRLVWTRKIPLAIKNMHRKFWGMSELKRAPIYYEQGLTKAQDRARIAVQATRGIISKGLDMEGEERT